MHPILNPDSTFDLITGLIDLRRAVPLVNGAALSTLHREEAHGLDGRLELRFYSPDLGDGFFGLEVNFPSGEAEACPPAEGGWLRYWVEGLPDDLLLDSFGLRFAEVENLRQYLRQGYYSWDGGFYVEPEAVEGFGADEIAHETGFAVTQLLPRSGAGSLVLGFDRHDRFQQTFTFDTHTRPLSLAIQTLWDRKQPGPQGRCQAERLLIFTHPEVEEGLRAWARQVAVAAPRAPRLPAQPITGWCSWYNLYAYIDEANLLEHLHAAADTAERERLPMRVFQIDDGFTPEMGDWLEVKPQFPRGMKPLLDEARAAGFIPGLWIGPFMVGNRSHLFREHPDWVVRDRQTGGPLVQWQLYAEFRWHKRSEEYYILDATHPEAFDYLRRVFRTWRREWGCDYFKTDFMHFGSEHGPQRALWHTPGLTRIEIWRKVAEMIREEIGEALWLGCGCPLWASIGLVDAVRIGRDVGVVWRGGLSAQSLLRDQATRNFANQILWQSDPDCVLLRERYHHLSDAEVNALAVYAGMTGGVLMTSDHLDELSPRRLALWKLLLNDAPRRCDYPLLGQTPLSYVAHPEEPGSGGMRHTARATDPLVVQVRRPIEPGGLAALHCLNVSDETAQSSLPLADLGFAAPLYAYDWTEQQALPGPVDRLVMDLPSHTGRLFFLSPTPITAAPDRLP